MVAQVVGAARQAKERGRALTNIVMMGMGEPLHNYAETMQMVAILHDPAGMNLGARRITISTSGVVPRIDALAEEPWQVNLAVSLHAPDDALRDKLVPINTRYPVATLMAACRRYIERTGRRVSFEYALMRGINDSDETARELAALLRGELCHVNVIPLNPVDVLPYERPDPAGIERFAGILRDAGIPTTVRYSRGLEIDAACGQLRAKAEKLAAEFAPASMGTDTTAAAPSLTPPHRSLHDARPETPPANRGRGVAVSTYGDPQRHLDLGACNLVSIPSPRVRTSSREGRLAPEPFPNQESDHAPSPDRTHRPDRGDGAACRPPPRPLRPRPAVLPGPAAAQTPATTTITIGESNSPAQVDELLAAFEATGDEPVTTVTVDETARAMEGIFDTSGITSAYSSTALTCLDQGAGLEVATRNITVVPPALYAMALATAGIDDATWSWRPPPTRPRRG
jgi:hypothetical protein